MCCDWVSVTSSPAAEMLCVIWPCFPSLRGCRYCVKCRCAGCCSAALSSSSQVHFKLEMHWCRLNGVSGGGYECFETECCFGLLRKSFLRGWGKLKVYLERRCLVNQSGCQILVQLRCKVAGLCLGYELWEVCFMAEVLPLQPGSLSKLRQK